MKKDIIYPFFIECCKFTTDVFWKNIFQDLAYGITPYGTYINKDFLTCNYKDKEFVYKIVKKEPSELFNDIYDLFKNKLSLISRDEIIKKKDDIKGSSHENIYEDWSSIKKKNLKEIMIEKYAIKMSKKHNLSITQTKYLVSLIFLSFIFKVFSSNDIIMENGQIEHINGIDYENGKVHFKKSIYSIQVNISPEIIVDKALMADEWNRFLETLRKQ